MQAGFLAMAAAAYSYDQSAGATFLTWLSKYLLTEFNAALGRRTQKQALDPINTALSLESPLSQDDDDLTLGDTIADKTDSMADVEERIYAEQLHNVLEQFLSNTQDAEILKLRYYAMTSASVIAGQLQSTVSEIKNREQKALRQCRQQFNSKAGAALRQLIDESTAFFRPAGVGVFQRTHTSAVEAAVFQREQLEREFKRMGVIN